VQANCSQLHSPPGAAGSEDASASQCAHARLTECSCLHSGDVHIQINSIPKECTENPGSRNIRSGVHSRTHGCVHSRLRSHSHNEARQPDETATESGDHVTIQSLLLMNGELCSTSLRVEHLHIVFGILLQCARFLKK
uniref:Uncharacterized protein n=1 Tax=Equus asinus asinus TaxID=83772 RepID=A0A8C4LGX2_EQUAS